MRKRMIALLIVQILMITAFFGCTPSTPAASTTSAAPSTSASTTAPAGTTAASPGALSGDPVVVGCVLPMTGDLGVYGELQWNGINLAVDEINAAGGVLGGRPLKVEIFDDKGNANDAVAGAQKFIDDPKVVAILGTNSSGTSLAMAPLCANANILQTNGSSSAMALLDYRTFFRTINDSKAQTAFAAKWSYEDFGKTAVVIAANNDWGKDMAVGFKNSFEALGGTVKSTEYVDSSATDYRSAITRMNAEKVDVVYCSTEGYAGVTFRQQSAELGFDIPCVATTAFMNDLVLQAGGTDLDGVNFITEFYLYDTDPIIQDFCKKYSDTYKGALASQQSANHYEALYVISYAIEKAGSTDRAAIVDAAYEIEPFQGITGMIQYDGNALVAKDYTKMTIKDGKFALYTK